jgi:hypothetical protein
VWADAHLGGDVGEWRQCRSAGDVEIGWERHG